MRKSLSQRNRQWKYTVKQKYWYLIHTWSERSDKPFKCTVVNQALPSLYGGSLEITLTVPLNTNFRMKFTKKLTNLVLYYLIPSINQLFFSISRFIFLFKILRRIKGWGFSSIFNLVRECELLNIKYMMTLMQLGTRPSGNRMYTNMF